MAIRGSVLFVSEKKNIHTIIIQLHYLTTTKKSKVTVILNVYNSHVKMGEFANSLTK